MIEVKKKGWQKPRRMKKKRVKRGKEKRRKKRTKRRQSKEDVRVVFLWRLLKSFVKGETWRDPFKKLDDLSECEPVSCALVRVVPDVTDVPVSLLLW